MPGPTFVKRSDLGRKLTSFEVDENFQVMSDAIGLVAAAVATALAKTTSFSNITGEPVDNAKLVAYIAGLNITPVVPGNTADVMYLDSEALALDGELLALV